MRNLQDKKFISPAEKAMLGLCLSVAAYAGIRAFLISITHDEAYSFYNMKKFWHVEALCTGNTHWLNSAAIRLAILLKLESLGAIRWLSILSAFAFAILSWMISRSEEFRGGRLICLSVLLLNPYIIDWFSVARGYAPGLALELAAIFLAVRAQKVNQRNLATLALLLAGLSAVANFSYVYFFGAFSLVYFWRYYLRGFRPLKVTGRRFLVEIVFTLGIILLVKRAFRFIHDCSNDVVGAGTDDVCEAVRIFADAYIYGKFPLSMETVSLLGGLALLVILISCLAGLRADKYSLRFTSSLIFLIIFLMVALNFCIAKLPLPSYRSAVFMFPAAALPVACLLSDIAKHRRFIRAAIVVVLTLNFIAGMNLKSIMDFRIQADLEEAMDWLEERKTKTAGIAPELYGGYRNYHQMTWQHHYSFFGKPIRTNLPKGRTKDMHHLKQFERLVLFPPYDMSYYTPAAVSLKAEKYFPATGTMIVKVIPLSADLNAGRD